MDKHSEGIRALINAVEQYLAISGDKNLDEYADYLESIFRAALKEIEVEDAS